MLVLNYMDTTSDQLSCYGNHFTDVVSTLEGDAWDTKAPIIDVFATFLLLACSKLSFMSLHLLGGIYIYNADGEHVSDAPYVLKVDATIHYLSKEHLPFAITAILILVFLLLPPFLLIFYPCKIFSRCLQLLSQEKVACTAHIC